MMGVEMVLRSNSTKARRKMIARGVAGRNMASDNGLNQTSVVLLMFGERVCARHWPATRSEVGGCREGKRARADERAIRRVSDGDGAYGWYGCVCVWAGGARVARDGVIRQRETSWRWRRSAGPRLRGRGPVQVQAPSVSFCGGEAVLQSCSP